MGSAGRAPAAGRAHSAPALRRSPASRRAGVRQGLSKAMPPDRRMPRARTSIGSHGIVAAMPTALKTTVTELPESRVRVQVEVRPSEIEDRLARKARQLGREMKLPGFRRGKVPAPLVIQTRGTRGRAGGSGPRHAWQLVLGCDRDGRHRAGGRSAAGSRRSARGRERHWSSRSRSACCRLHSSATTRAWRSVVARSRRGRGDAAGDRRAARSLGAPGDRRASCRLGRLRRSRLPRLDRRASRSRAARGAISSSSSARAT